MLAPSNRPKSRLRRTLSARAKSKGQRAKRLALSPSPSLAWLSDRAWLHPSRVGSSPFALGSLPLFARTLSPLAPMFATTYTWTQANSTDFTDAGNWTPNRTPLATSDVLVFNGAFTPTATVTNIPSQTIGELHAQGNVTANLTPAAGVVALSIAGGAAAIDLEVASGSALNIAGCTTTTNTLLITLGVSAIGSISGNMTFSGAQHSLQAASATGITFNSGATFTQGTLVTGNVFGSGTANSIVFASGSTFNQLAGSNPFQKTQPASVVVFQTGSLFSLQANLTPSFSGRTYANFELNSAAASPVVTGGNAVSMDNLTITAGTLNFNMTGTPGHAIKGNISVASGATLTFNPATAGTVNLSGSSVQTISGPGTITTSALSTIAINNSSGVTLNNPMTINGTLTLTSGTFTNGANLTLGNGATITRQSGSALSATPTFGTSVNVTYVGSSSLSTSNELPTSTTVLNNLTANMSAGGVSMGSAITVNGTFSLITGSLNAAEFDANQPVVFKGNWSNTNFIYSGGTTTFSGTTAWSANTANNA